MTQLSVNVNKVATLRNTRAVGIPSVVRAARLCLEAGAHGITIHPRPDARHIRPADVYELADMLRSYPRAEFNIEGNPFQHYMEFAREVRPTQCTLVPDDPAASTSDHGWDLSRDGENLAPVVNELKSLGCRVSLFMDATSNELETAAKLGVDRIELYTAPYAEDFGQNREGAVASYIKAARTAQRLGLGINAGHDLNLDNLVFFLTSVPNVLEVSIGHALIADALEFGLPTTIRKYLAIVEKGKKLES